VLASAASLSLSASANAAFAIVTISAMAVSRWGGLIPVLLVVGAVLLLRRQRDLETKFANLELLYRFSHAIAGVTEATDVLTTTLGSMKELLACEHAELLLAETGAFLRLGLHPTGALVHQRVEPDEIERRVLDAGEAVMVEGRADAALGAALDRRAWRDALAVPFQGADGLAGVMTVGQKLGFGSSFGPADRRLLETFASHSSVALRGSDLLQRLRDEVAARSYDALHDSLTGLGNRTLFRQHLKLLFDEAHGAPVAVLMVDIDNFREINDTLGHHAGDDVLRAAAERISGTVGASGMACRLGGDEFAVVLGDPTSGDEATAMATAIREAVAEPLLAESMNLELQCAIGIAVSPEDGGSGEGLLRRADIAMFGAKATKSGIERYEPGRDPNTTRRLRLTSDLRKAISSATLELWYQPKAELATRRVVGVEALARWRHPRYGAVPPDEFIALAEQSGSISALTWVVLEKAFAQKRAWEYQGLTVDVSVNVSARSLLDVDLLPRLKSLLDRHRVAPSGIVVELTESSVMADVERAEAVLDQILALGLQLSVDDFGTGYSSLSRLSRISASEIKIDKSFVTGMLCSNNAAIVATTVELAHELDKIVTAEGVEDRATWDRLVELGCDWVQGYYLSRPMPAGVATTWLLEAVRRHGTRQPATNP
jgi:diguanylate cyclase (GGDEF)-like protein